MKKEGIDQVYFLPLLYEQEEFWLLNYNIVIWWNTTDSLKNEQLLRVLMIKKDLQDAFFKKKKVKWGILHAFICTKEVGVEIYRNLPTNT